MDEPGRQDVFVGNLSFNTTEEQLKALFSEVGAVTNVRVVLDKETQRSKGFAFVEFSDAATALSAIRNLDGNELNGRKIRVSYSNSGNLKDMARQIGQAVPGPHQPVKTVESVVGTYKLHELYDILEIMKALAMEENGEKAKTVFMTCPELMPALLEIQVRQTAATFVVTAPTPAMLLPCCCCCYRCNCRNGSGCILVVVIRVWES